MTTRSKYSVADNTFASVVRAYLVSGEFAKLAPSTKWRYQFYLSGAEMRGVLGDKPVHSILVSDVQECLDALADRPGAQYALRVAIGAVESFALPRALLPHPITTKVKLIGSKGGHKPWTDAQIACAERHARVAVSRLVTLAAETGQRGSDLVKMRWSDIEDDGINVTQKKTGLQLWIPFTAALRSAIDTWQKQGPFILVKADGQPYGNRQTLAQTWIRERNANPELAPCAGMVLHGLRASAVIRLRRAGCEIPEIISMVGLSAQMVERYARFADQKQSARAAVYRLDGTRLEQNRRDGTKTRA